MGVRDFTELQCWQLCTRLKRQVYAFTAALPASRDYDYCRQIRRSASSAPRNIAEGFGRYNHREISQYLKIALGSLQETQDALIDGKDREYVTATEFNELWSTALSALRSTKAWKRYIDASPDPPPPNG